MINNKTGVAMLVILSVIIMLLVLGGAALMLSTGHFGTSYYQIKRARAFYTAEAAMYHTLWQLRTGQISPGYSGTFPNDINGIQGNNISITVANANPVGTEPEGVCPITIQISY